MSLTKNISFRHEPGVPDRNVFPVFDYLVIFSCRDIMSGQKTTRPRRLIRAAVWTTAIVIILLAASLFYLTLRPGEDLLRAFAEKRLGDMLGMEIRMRRLETDLLSRVRIDGLEIAARDSARSEPAVSLGSILVNYRLTDLRKGRFTVEGIVLDSLSLDLRRTADGVFDFPFPVPPTEKREGGGPDRKEKKSRFQIGAASLRDGLVRYSDGSMPLDAEIHGVSLDLEHGEPGGYFVRSGADSALFRYGGVSLAARRIGFEGEVDDGGILLKEISMSLPGFAVTGAGRVGVGTEAGALDGKVMLSGNTRPFLETIGALLPAGLDPIDAEAEIGLILTGSMAAPRLEIGMRVPSVNYRETTANSVVLEALWAGGILRMTDFGMEIFGGRIVGSGEIAADSLLSHSLELTVDDVSLDEVRRTLWRDPVDYTGIVKGRIRSSGPLRMTGGIALEGDFDLVRARYGGRRIPDLATRLSCGDGVVAFDLSQGDSWLRSSLALSGELLEGKYVVHLAELEHLAGMVNLEGVTGQMNIEGTISGSRNSPAIVASCAGKRILYRNVPVDTLLASIRYEESELHVDDGYLAGTVASIDPARTPFDLSGIGGGFSYFGRVKGSPRNPVGEFDVSLIEPSFRGMRFDRGLVRATASAGIITLDRVLLERGPVQVDASGRFSLSESAGQLRLSFSDGRDPDHAEAEGNLGGEEAPGITPEGSTGEFFGSPFEPVLSASAGSASTRTGPLGILDARFDLKSPQDMRFEITGTDIDLAPVASVTSMKTDLEGILGFHLAVSGSASNPGGVLRFFLEKPGFGGAVVDSVMGEIAADRDSVEVRMIELFNGGHSLRMRAAAGPVRAPSGEFVLSTSAVMNGRIEGTGLDLEFLSPLLGPEARISGILSGDFAWSGPMARPLATGFVGIEGGNLRLSGKSPEIRDIRLEAVFRDSTVFVESLRGRTGEKRLLMTGFLTRMARRRLEAGVNFLVEDTEIFSLAGVFREDSLDASLRVRDLDLSILGALVPGAAVIKPSGTMNTRISMNGTRRNPVMNGELEIRGLAFHPPMIDKPFQGGRAEMSFDGREVTLDSLLLRHNQGSITGSGRLAYGDGGPVGLDVGIDVKALNLVAPKVLRVEIASASFRYTREEEFFYLLGDAVLGETRLLHDFQPRQAVSYLQKVERPVKELPRFLQKTRFDIRLRESDKIWIDNNLARIRLHTELGLMGGPSRPIITGRLVAKEGYILYLDRKLKVARGVLDFADPTRLNPFIDVQAEVEIKSYQTLDRIPYAVTMSINGPLDQARIELVSTPPLDRMDIIALLTIGATREQFTGESRDRGSSTFREVLQERLSDYSSAKISGYATRRVGNLLGLDEVTLEGNLFRFDDSWGPELLASKQISDRMQVTYTTTVGHLNDQSVRLNYRLTRHFSLQGETDRRGDSGMDVKFNLKF